MALDSEEKWGKFKRVGKRIGMDSWKSTKIKSKTKHWKGMRLEREGGFGARRRTDTEFWARLGCDGGGVP